MIQAMVKAAALVIVTVTQMAPAAANTLNAFFPQGYVSHGKIAVGIDLSLPGNLLCDDGQNIQFKSRNACYEANVPLPHASKFDCNLQLLITPISEVEEIFIPEDPDKNILRFFTVPTTYEEKTYRKLLGEDGSWRLQLVKTRVRLLPECSHTPRTPFANVFETREATTEQKYLILALRKKGMSILNTPHGALNVIARLPAKRTESASLPMNFYPLQKTSPQPASLRLKTPHCNPAIDDRVLNRLLGGESTGGGYQSMRTKALQSLSVGMEIRSLLNRDQWTALKRRPFDPKINAFAIECDTR
jgi:hypothetical protein